MPYEVSEMLARLPNFLKTFGLSRGALLFAKIYLTPRKPSALFDLTIHEKRIALRNVTSDTSIFFQIMVKQEYGTENWPTQHQRLQNAYLAMLRQGKTPVIVDAGANIGLSAIWFARCYPAAKIYAVEPDADNLSVLRRNTADLSNVAILAGAIWDAPARLTIGNPGAGAGALRVVPGEGSLRSYSISEIIAMEPDGEPVIVKIDIEGGEAALFRSNTEWAERAELMVIETHDWLYPTEGTSRTFLRCIAGLPVDFVFRGENVFCFRYDAVSSRQQM